MRHPSSSVFVQLAGSAALLLLVACGGIERGPSVVAVDAGSKDMAGSGSCTNCAGKCCLNKCVDVKTDVHNCGGCGIACAVGTQCIGGVCQCAGPGGQGGSTCTKDQACCSGKCVNVMSDGANCGACGKDCSAAMETCIMGQCGCGSPGAHCNAGETCCEASCANTDSDATNCGGCGNTCAGGQSCAGGMCSGGGGGNCNPPCMAPLTCQNGMCGIGGGGGGICMSDADCKNGQKCVMPIPGLPIGLCM